MTDIQDALDLYDEARTGWSDIYDAARSDQRFYAGEQWLEEDAKARKNQNRPTLTINRLPQFVHQVTNDIRQNVPQIKVLPVDDKADVDTAKILQGWIKGIEASSNAPQAYDTAAESAVKSSIGFFRIDHGYVSPDTFEQEISIKRVTNALSVLIDPNSIEADGSDSTYGFVLDTMPVKAFNRQYKGASAVSFGDEKDKQELKGSDLVTVAEFFQLVPKDEEIALMNDGTVLPVAKAQEMMQMIPGLQVVRTRTIQRNTVARKKLSGADELEKTTFPGSYIPLIPVYGEEHWTDGQRGIYSLIRFAKDPQKMHNYWASEELAWLQTSRKEKFLTAAGQVDNYADHWSNPGLAMNLPYDQVDKDGKPAPPPIPIPAPQIPTGIINARQGTVDDMKATMGLYDASIGQRSNEKSGIAIQARQREGDVATFHFVDNLNRSICHGGRVILSMRQDVLDTPRLIRILDQEDNAKTVGIGQGKLAPGQDKIYDVAAGRYDVSVIAGPSFTTRRQETQALMTQLMQANPALLQVMGDLMFKYSDMPGADVIAERLKKTIPPQLTQGEDGQGDKQLPPEAQQAIEQMKQQIQLDQSQIQQATEAIKGLQQQLAECESELKNKQAEQANRQEELHLNAAKVKLDAFKAKIDAVKTFMPQGQPGPDGQQMPADPNQMAQALPIIQQAMAGLDHGDQLDKEERRQQAVALMQSLAQISKGLAELTAVVQKPKQVVRDATGKLLGVQ